MSKTQDILNTAPFTVIKWKNSVGWPVEWVSENIKALTGYSRQAFLEENVNFYDLLDVDTIDLIDQQLLAAQENVEERVKLGIYRLRHKDAHLVWIEQYISVIRNELGTITGYVGYLLDVSDRMGTEQQFKTNVNETRALIKALPDTILQISNNGKLKKYLSQRKEGSGEHKVEVYLSDTFPADFAEHIPGYLESVIASGDTEVHEFIKTSPAREILHYEARFSRVNDHDALIIIRDITERKRQEESLKQAMHEINRASSEKNRFLSNMSHELRTPLNAILGFAQLLSTDGKSDSELSNEIIHAGEHLLKLVTTILDISKIEAGRIDLDIESVSLSSLIDKCHGLIKPMAEQFGISLSVNSPDDEIIIDADETRLVQVVLNLLSNAIKYNKPRGHVDLFCEQDEDGQVWVKVRDTGAGLTTDQMKQLFQPFERVGAEQSDIEGSGLGLALTKQLVELMDGLIQVESKAGKGSTFSICFTMTEKKPNPEKSGADMTDDVSIGQPPNKNGTLNLLYIEDNPQNQRLITSIVENKTPHTVHIAKTGEEGIRLAKSLNPELILLDITLPDIDGYDVYDALRSYPATRHTPVIAISARVTRADLQKAELAGFYKYITKPVNINFLLESIYEATGMTDTVGQQPNVATLD